MSIEMGPSHEEVQKIKDAAAAKAKGNAITTSATEKLQAERAKPKDVIAPLVTPQFKTPASSIEPVNNPTLQDFISEAQKLGTQKVQAQAAILGEDTGDIADAFARRLHSQNIGSTSGAGKELTDRAVEDQQRRLEPYALQIAADLGQSELEFRQGQEETLRTEANTRRENTFNQILAGTIDKSQMSQQDWSALGITDPDAINTLTQVDLKEAMIAKGLDPNNSQDVTAYRTELRNAESTKLRQGIISNYAEINDGQIPSPDEVEMMMYVFGGGTGTLTSEEESAIIAKFNDEQWARTIAKAEAMNPKERKVLCTEIHRQGFITDEVFKSDDLVGKYYATYYPEVVIGYHSWAIPLAEKMSKSKLLTYILKPFIMAWANEMHFHVTGKGKSSLIGRILENIGIPICESIGKRKESLKWLAI